MHTVGEAQAEFGVGAQLRVERQRFAPRLGLVEDARRRGKDDVGAAVDDVEVVVAAAADVDPGEDVVAATATSSLSRAMPATPTTVSSTPTIIIAAAPRLCSARVIPLPNRVETLPAPTRLDRTSRGWGR